MNTKLLIAIACLVSPLALATGGGGDDHEKTTTKATTPKVTTPKVTTTKATNPPEVTGSTPGATTPQVTYPTQGNSDQPGVTTGGPVVTTGGPCATTPKGGDGGHGGFDKNKVCVKNPSGLLDVQVYCNALCENSGCLTCVATCVANAQVLNLCSVKALVNAVAAVCPGIVTADVCAKACLCCNLLGTINICLNACLNIGLLGIL